MADGRRQGVIGLAWFLWLGVAAVVVGPGATTVSLSRGDDLIDEAVHFQALEGHQPIEVSEGHLAHEPLNCLGPLFGRVLLWVRPDVVEVLVEGALEPEVVNGRLVVLLNVGQPVHGQPALVRWAR